MRSQNKNPKKHIVQAAISVAAVFAAVFIVFASGILSSAEKKTYDSRMRFSSKRTEISDRISLVLLDQESLDWAKKERGWSWPWPREAYAEMVRYFNRAGASSLAFDMIYSEPSIYGSRDDEAFAKASEDFGKVIQTVYYENEESSDGTYPIPVLRNSAAEIGSVSSSLDKSDRVARRNLLHTNAGNKELSLALASLKTAGVETDSSEIPAAKEGGMYIKYVDDLARFVPYSAKSILISEAVLEDGNEKETEDFIPPEQFKDNFVFFALYAPGLFDVCATPVSSTYPGVGVHACQLNSILNGDYLQDVPDFVPVILILISVLAGFMLAKSVHQEKNSSLALKTFLAVLICFGYAAANYAAFNSGYILPFIIPIFGFVLAYLTAVFEDYLTEGHQKRFIKSAFKHYLSADVIEQLIANPESLHLGGEEKEITAYFSDVQGFTSISENLTPTELTELLNVYLSAMTDIIQDYGGYVDKYEGDAIVAFFGAPVDQKDNAKRAVDAALACQKKLEEMQEELVKVSKKPFIQRIGLNTGKAIVGNMGSKTRFNYTMMGDTVNLASRLEGINKQFGTYTMCSEATMKSALENGSEYAFRPLANIAVVGKKTGVKVFNPMTKEEFERMSEIRKTYDDAYEKFTTGDFEKAKEIFESNAENDQPSAKFVEKCQKMISNPPENWDGILRATEK
ncbi:MAG: adenylate/guanylate cyclase domain-containing protein [Treponema sp.]|nr:adenylate/guanylate cyclase domain-containing protein [Treponema sp.]